jgi:hypothetical protein
MDVRVIPIETGRLVWRDVHDVVKRLPGSSQHPEDVISGSVWRRSDTVKMNIDIELIASDRQ